MGRQFVPRLLRDVDMSHATESLESQDIRLYACVSLRWGGGNRARGGDIVKESCVVKCLQPVGFRQVGVGKHVPYFVQEGLVQAFSHTIMLWCVGGG